MGTQQSNERITADGQLVYLPNVSDAVQNGGYLDLSRVSCLETRKNQDALAKKFDAPSPSTSYRVVPLIGLDPIASVLKEAKTAKIIRINLNGWKNSQLVKLLIDSYPPDLNEVDLQDNDLDIQALDILRAEFVEFTAKENTEFRVDKDEPSRVYKNRVIRIDVSNNPKLDPILHRQEFSIALQEKKDYQNYEQLKKDYLELKKEYGDKKAFLIDKLNDLASFCWSLRKDSFFATEAARVSEKAYNRYKIRFETEHPPEDYVRNIIACNKYLENKLKVDEYAQKLVSTDVDKIVSWKQPTRVNRPIIILSMDGGGMRGLAEIKMYECIERYLFPLKETVGSETAPTDTLREKLDLLCGTSTGGIIALGLALKNMTAENGRKLYYKIGKDIFTGRSTLSGLWTVWKDGGWYDVSKLESALKSEIGEEVLQKSNEKRKELKQGLVFVTTANNGEPTNEYLLRNYFVTDNNKNDSTCKAYEAARCSSAAPYFFSPYTIQIGVPAEKTCMVDGGVLNNNPSWLAYAEAKQHFGLTYDYILISLGTGRMSEAEKEKLKKKTNFQKITPKMAINMLVNIATNSEALHKRMETDSKTDSRLTYFRFNPENLPVDKLDESDPKKLAALEEVTFNYMNEKATVEQLAKLKKLFDLIDFTNPRPNDSEREHTPEA